MMRPSQPADAGPEYRVLLETLGAGRDARSLALAPERSSAGFDPEKLAALARRHGLRPRVYRRLRELPATDSVRKTQVLLAPAVGRAAKHALLLAAELLAVLDLLHCAGIPAIPYKGPVLASQLYGAVDLRSYRDLDLLIPLSEVKRARAVLAERDYQPYYPLSAAQEAALERVGYHFNLARERDGMLLELHWRIADPYFSRMGEDQLLGRNPSTVSFMGRRVPTLAPEILLPALCVHAAKHHWDQLSYVGDISRLLEVHAEWDWEQVLTTARSSGSLRRLRVGLALCRNLLGTPLPESVLAACQADAAASNLAAWFEKRLAADSAPQPGLVSHARVDLAGMDTFQDRLEYLRGVLAPNVSDWASNRLPPALSPLLPLLRPLRLLRSYGLAGRDVRDVDGRR